MIRGLLLAAAALLLAPATHAAQTPPTGSAAAVRLAAAPAFAAAYNLNYDQAVAMAERLVATHPESSGAHRALATILWMHLLFDRGALTIDHYLGGVSQSNIQLPAPPSDRAATFQTHIGRAITLAEAAVRRSSTDVEARFDLGMAHGLQASWMATIEGKVRGAFGSARRAFDHHEWVLKHAPSRHDAGLIVGTYRYTVAALSFPKRWLAYIAGFGGDKALGVRLIEAASTVPTTATDAKLALVLVHSREGRQREALAILKDLLRDHPENRLLQLEAGSAAWRAGEAAEADQLLTAGLAWHDRDARPKTPGERALWVYKRGQARVSLNRLADAETDLRAALAQGPAGWVRGRTHLELGKIADLRGRRADAVEEYGRARALCQNNRDPWCVEQSEQFRRRPFVFTTRR